MTAEQPKIPLPPEGYASWLDVLVEGDLDLARYDHARAELAALRAEVADLKAGILALGMLPGMPRDGGPGGKRRFMVSMQYEKYWAWNRFVTLVQGEEKGSDCDACNGKGYFYVSKRPYFCEVCSGWSWLGPKNEYRREERRAEQSALVERLLAEAAKEQKP